MGRIDIDWEEVLVNSPSRDREVDVCFASPSSAPRASAAKVAVTRVGVTKALPGDERRRGSPDRHHRRKFGALRDDVDWCVAERRTAAHGDDGARRLVTRAAAKAAVGRGQDAHAASKDVYDWGLEDEQTEHESNRFCLRLPPIQKNKYCKNTLKSQGRVGKRDPISVDKMYSSQPSSTSLSAKRTHAIDPEVSDHEKCQKVESSLPRRFSKRRKEQLQNSSSVYSRKVQDVVLLDDEDMKPEEEVNCEMSDRRNELKIYYPSRDNRESVELTRSDIKCLDPGVYLSSPVINFYIQYIQRNRLCTEDFRDKFYIFNTYFYGKLEEALYCPDKHMATLIKDRFGSTEQLKVIEEDITKFHIRSHFLPFMKEKYHATKKLAKVVSNLPFNVSTEVVKLLLPMGDVFSVVVLMLQDETAVRLADTSIQIPEYRPINVFVNFYSKPEYKFRVDRENFFPQPKVNGAVISFKLKNAEEYPPVSSPKSFFSMVNSAFMGKRKMLRKSLQHLCSSSEIEAALDNIGLPVTARPSDLILDDFVRLHNHLTKV